jgi:uncharacterized protein YcfJ
MNKWLLSACVATFTVSATAEQSFHYDYATVLESTPVIKLVERTDYERECKPKVIRYQTRSKNDNSLLGTVVGAAIGHALGHRSKHRTGATVAGAIIGNNIAKSNGPTYAKERVENHCQMIPVTWQEEQIVGYNVVYRYNDRTFETRLPYEPGDTLKIRVLLNPIANPVDDQ